MIKIIGIGQSLRGDDALGLEAVRLWQEKYQNKLARPDVVAELAELPGTGLLDLIEGAQTVIFVDAVYSGAAPGTIHRLVEDEISAFSGGSGSAHGWGVAETISLGRQIMPGSMPEKLILIGIEARQLKLGDTLSPEVKSALPEVARLIEQYIETIIANDPD